MKNKSFYEICIKRLVDISGAAIALMLISPILLITAILVKIKLGSPILFRQKRPGLNEKIFTMYKFRTMSDKRDSNGKLLPDENRLTNLGKILRKTSIDELPELWNILKGEMSIVGPRPLRVQYLDYYTEEEHKRHSVRPGLTGPAQVNGRSFLSWDERFKLDLYYVGHISFTNDLKIIIETVKCVLQRKGVANGKENIIKDFDQERRDKNAFDG